MTNEAAGRSPAPPLTAVSPAPLAQSRAAPHILAPDRCPCPQSTPLPLCVSPITPFFLPNLHCFLCALSAPLPPFRTASSASLRLPLLQWQ